MLQEFLMISIKLKLSACVEGAAKRNQKVLYAATTIATAQAKGIKVKL